MKKKSILGIVMSLVLIVGLLAGAATPVLAADPTSSVTITLYASDGTTILDQTTVDYTWMMENLPVYGDGVTHYYHQGPTFDSDNMWDPEEMVNIDSRDYGAAMGTAVKDLCDLVGGAPEGSEVEIKAVDNFSKSFAAEDVNDPEPEQGEMVITWYTDGTADGISGFVPDYDTGMRLLFFAETLNPEDKHVFGNWDMHETLAEDYWHYYYDGTTYWPSSSGLSVKWVNQINIFTAEEEPPEMDVLYDGTVLLNPGETFDVISYYVDAAGTTYTVSQTTPLGALDVAATTAGFTYAVSDKKMATKGILLLDDVSTYTYDNPGEWYAYVNDVYKDGFSDSADGLNVFEVVDGDTVEYYYAEGVTDAADLAAVQAIATAAVKTVVSTEEPPEMDVLYDGTVLLNPGETFDVISYYVDAAGTTYTVSQTTPLGALDVAATTAGFTYAVSDKKMATKGILLLDDVSTYTYDNPGEWYAYVNDVYKDGFSDSADGLNVFEVVDGDTVEYYYAEGVTDAADLAAVQAAATAAVKTVVSTGVTPTDWTLEMVGDVGDIITQSEFEEGLACPGSDHYREWTDIDGNIWSGVPLWVLLGVVDDIETDSHWTFNDDVAAAGYTVNVIAGDGFSKSFDSTDVARSDDYIVANQINGEELDDSWPLRLVGDGVTKSDGSLGGKSVGNIVKIEIPELQTPEPETGSWNLALTGKITDVISQAEFEDALACSGSGHYVEWNDIDGNVWSGMSLWFLTGWVDDRVPHDYNANQAMAGYTVLVKAGDGYTKDFASADVAWSNNYIIANQFNGAPLDDSWPLRLVGDGVTKSDGSLSGKSVGNVVEIELTDFQTVEEIPELHIIKYDVDRTSILDETTVDYLWMMENLDVIGDGETVYKFEGITNDPDDIWDADETYPGGFKIQNAVKGTRIKDLCDLVGGMGAGTEIKLVASDGYETTLPYSSIYTDSTVQACQGDAILAWWSDGEYVPYYSDGMRLFFTPDGDNVYGQWDMHETLPLQYWHYYYDSSTNTMYPSCAGLSAKWVTTIEIHSVPEADWTLELDGTDIGGLYYEVSKTYFEQALACQFGANHKAEYTDGDGNVWEGIPLWFLAGFVDDEDQHSDNAFNDALAEAGYQVVITAADGYLVTIDSTAIIRNSDYIVANSVNDAHIPDTDDDWPLKLVGAAVSGPLSISQFERIELLNYPEPMTIGIEEMFINFTWLRPRVEDTISINGSLVLPEEGTYDLSADDVTVNVDGVVVNVPAGSFRKASHRKEIYSYTSGFRSSPKITMRLNFDNGSWSLAVTDVDASAIDSYDGVTVELTIGDMVGSETVDMRIDSLSYNAE